MIWLILFSVFWLIGIPLLNLYFALEEAKYQEELIQQKAKQDKKETERQRILTNNKKFLDLVDSINPGRYAMSMDEMQALYASKYHDTFRLIYNSFKAGFLKGQKAERARCRRNSTKS